MVQNLPMKPMVKRRDFLRNAAAASAISLPIINMLASSSAASSDQWHLVAMEHFPPYNYLKDGQFIGVDVDILTQATYAIGVELKIMMRPWKRALLAFEAGEVDGLFQVAPTIERHQAWHLTGPLRPTQLAFAVKASSAIKSWSNLSDFNGLRIGTVAGFTYDKHFIAGHGFEIEPSVDDETSLRKLMLDRVDLVIGGRANLAYIRQMLGAEQKIRFLAQNYAVQGRYVSFLRNPRGDALSERLQKQLDLMHESGAIDEILLRHNAG